MSKKLMSVLARVTLRICTSIEIGNESCDMVLTILPNNDLHLVGNPVRVPQIVISY